MRATPKRATAVGDLEEGDVDPLTWPPDAVPPYVVRIDKHWQATYYTQAVGDRLVISRVEITPIHDVPPGGVTRRTMAQAKIGQARAFCRLFGPPSRLFRSPTNNAGRRQRGRPPTLTRQDYERVVHRYMALLASGATSIPKRLAEEFEEEFGGNRSTMRSILRRARQYGIRLGFGVATRALGVVGVGSRPARRRSAQNSAQR